MSGDCYGYQCMSGDLYAHHVIANNRQVIAEVKSTRVNPCNH